MKLRQGSARDGCQVGRSKTGVPSSLGPYLFFTSVVTYSNGEKNFSFE